MARSRRAPTRARPGPTPVAGTHPVDTGTATLVQHTDDPGLWTLLVNGVPSSSLRPDDPARLDFEYLQQISDVLDAVVPAPAPLRVLHLGGAGCALPWALETTRPGSQQVVLELDGALTALVRTWFDLPRSPSLRIQAVDARAGLAVRREASADAVVRDVFAGDTTPHHLCTTEMTAEVRRVLASDGLYLVNVADRPPLGTLRAEIATVATVFAHVALVAETAVLRGRRYANAVLVGSDAPLPHTAMQRRLQRSGLSLRVVHGQRLTDMVAGARPLRD